ncbi:MULTISPECIES: heavy-metal-associated domain-containing protein [unclassified Streptomyces]|uniref:heavy-metal-associated domain-containing protein n=1 Tax=unclassified Streptomyces TaxID=2593676 RepID=UPI002E2AE231|nr:MULTISPECIES: heavy-metal-associated domain-containing protein [unclassified Streptomyces]WUB85148.1 heavy-metal-associated domain-containing protein [Streptomyces sp. NBC_00566]
MARMNFLVTGMSCGHCAASIKKALTGVPGVSEVDVDVTAGTVTVQGTDLDDTLLRAAIVEAGYEVPGTVAA